MNASFGRLSNSFLRGLARYLAGLLTCLKSRLQRGFDVPDRHVMEVQPVAVARFQGLEPEDGLGDVIERRLGYGVGSG